MQHIPDNEFDRLFKDRLMDAEVQPSEALWEHIAPQIVPKKKKRYAGLYWSAAATVLIAVSAGLLFKPQERIALHAPTVSTAVKPSSEQPVQVESQLDAVEETMNGSVTAATVKAGNDQALAKSQSEMTGARLMATENNSSAMQPNDEESHHHSVAAVQEPALALIQTQPAASNDAIVADQNDVAAEDPIASVALDEPAERTQESRPRIRNAGDLVNFVVDKIDKREQKFLEFRTDEDESSSLVAINIGPIKINQRKNNK